MANGIRFIELPRKREDAVRFLVLVHEGFLSNH